jgi:hypothetical protein
LLGADAEDGCCDRTVGSELHCSNRRAFGSESVINVVYLDARGWTAKESDAVAFLIKRSMKVPRDHGSDLAVPGEDLPEFRLVGELAGRVVTEVDDGMVERDECVAVTAPLQEHAEAIEFLRRYFAFNSIGSARVERDDRPISNRDGSKHLFAADRPHCFGIVVVAGNPSHCGSQTMKAIERTLI